jgi:lytic murein transglycosylase
MTRTLVTVVILFLLGSAATQAAIVNQGTTTRVFHTWIESDIWPEAKAAGVSRATFDQAFAGVTPDLGLPELTTAPPAVESQAEFRSPSAYFDQAEIARLVVAGRKKLKQWSPTLAAIEKRYDIPAAVIVAVWARESDFGQATLPEPAIRALATGAFLGRRPDLFRRELIAALQILEAGDIAPGKMRGSWAGALGQPQLLPSQFRKYAVDFDGDGRRDIWGSVPDSLASIANFLKQQGWKAGVGWGLEAEVPPNVPCSLEGPEQGKPIADWSALGVRRADGRPLPKTDAAAYLLMPAGRVGPAFIASGNFYTLKIYNNSDLYALYILHLSDRFSDNHPFRTAWGKTSSFGRAGVAAMQHAFEKEGQDVGGSDGLIGFKTRIAVGKWQARMGEPVTCYPDTAMMARMR